MKFETGKSGNPKGRSIGSKNIKTEQWEHLGTFIIEKGAERAIRILDEMGDELYLDAYTKLLGYFKPKLKAVDNKTDNTGNIIIDLGGGLTEPITGMQIINKDETPFERIRRVNNLEPEKKEAYDRLTTTGEILPSDFTHGIKFTSTPKEVDQDKPEPKKVLKPTEDIKPIEEIKPKVKKVSKYIVM